MEFGGREEAGDLTGIVEEGVFESGFGFGESAFVVEMFPDKETANADNGEEEKGEDGKESG